MFLEYFGLREQPFGALQTRASSISAQRTERPWLRCAMA